MFRFCLPPDVETLSTELRSQITRTLPSYSFLQLKLSFGLVMHSGALILAIESKQSGGKTAAPALLGTDTEKVVRNNELKLIDRCHRIPAPHSRKALTKAT